MTNCLKIVSTRLFIPNMGIQIGISRSACQILALTEGDMFSFRILKTLGKTEVDDVNIVFRAFCSSNEEVVWFDVTVDNSLFMDFLNSLNLIIE